LRDDAVETDAGEQKGKSPDEGREHRDQAVPGDPRSDELIEGPEDERNVRIGLGECSRDVALDRRAPARIRVNGENDRFREWLDLRERHVHRRHHARARFGIGAVAHDPDDLVAPLAVGQPNSYRPADRLLAQLIPAHERLVDDGGWRRARAVGVGKVSPTHERRSHGVEPAGACGIAPEPVDAQVLCRHRPIVDGDAIRSPATASEQWHPRQRCRPHARHARRGSAQPIGSRPTRVQRVSGGKIHLRHEQGLGNEAERQPLER
jgi:hypothetical protein